MIHWWTSGNLLRSRCEGWLQEKWGGKPWISVNERELPPAPRPGVPQEVVLLGNFAVCLSRVREWKNGSYRLWTLGSAARDAACKTLNIPGSRIGVIPRYELFPRLLPAKPLPRPGDTFELVFAGRISLAKNYLLLLHLASELQTRHRIRMKLVSFGPFDGFGAEGRGIAHSSRFETVVCDTIRRLSWTDRPFMAGSLEPEEWIGFPLERPVFVSLSTYLRDDFGVSAAQAQAAGWPCILSEWGGHRDAVGDNVLKLDPAMLGSPGESFEQLHGRALALAELLVRVLGQKRRKAFAEAGNRPRPKPITKEMLVRRVSAPQAILPRLAENDGAPELGGIPFLRTYGDAFGGTNPADRTYVLSPVCEPGWTSMREILKNLESAWAVAGTAPGGKVEFLPLERKAVFSRISDLSTASRIVLLQVAPNLVRFLRETWRIPVPLVIHTHGEATSGLLSMSRIEGLLTTGDVLVCASRAEARSLKACYPNARIEVVPFPVPDETSGVRPAGISRFAYIGRISEQKNLHTLLTAFWLARRKSPSKRFELHLFGGVDGLGSPNMGFRLPGYRTVLDEMVAKLGLRDVVKWHGFVPGGHWESVLGDESYVFVSTSLHADEDFGMAAAKALARGNAAILSAWGGHLDLKRSFPDAVAVVPVHGSELGPYVAPEELCSRVLDADQLRSSGSVGAGYGFREIAEKLRRLPISRSFRPIRISRFARELRAQFESVQRPSSEVIATRHPLRFQQAFTGYDDRIAHEFFRAYGMGEKREFPQRPGRWLLAPWVKVGPASIEIRDPHRGVREIELAEGGRIAVRDVSGEKHRLDPASARWLYERGYLIEDRLR